VIVDTVADKLKGEIMDLQHGIPFLKPVKVTGSVGKWMVHLVSIFSSIKGLLCDIFFFSCHVVEYEATAGSRICIVTAGARQREGESRLDLIQRNTDILKGIIPNLIQHSPHTILIIATNPGMPCHFAIFAYSR